jgi:hypothetical protein
MHPDEIKAVIVSEDHIPIKSAGIFACPIAWTGKHLLLWEEFSRNIIRWLSEREPKIFFVFVDCPTLQMEVRNEEAVISMDELKKKLI